MRFPSLDALARRAVATLAAFPWTIGLAATATAAAVVADDTGGGSLAERVAFVAMLGVPLSLALSLAARAWSSSLAYRVLTQLFALAFLAVFLAGWGGPERRHDAIVYFQLSAIFHLTVAFLPFLRGGSSGDVWEYNRRLFTGFLRSTLFSAVLFFGVLVALAALEQLFGIDLPAGTYLDCWFVAALLINTWIFAGSVHEEITFREWEGGHPRVLKVFAQYVLTPIVFVYLLILVAYLVKVLVTGEWPSGWIGWLVASVASSGLLGFLLVHPLRDDPGEGWIRFYGRVLFIGLMPAALMLLAAFWKRIQPYGLTELRIVGVLLGIWLLLLALRFTFRPSTGIRVIPISLALLLLVTVGGPFGLTSLSVDSQGRRFAQMVAAGDTVEASEALYFLIDRGAPDAIAANLAGEMPAVAWDSIGRWGAERDSAAASIMAAVGMKVTRRVGSYPGRAGWVSLNGSRSDGLEVSGFDWVAGLCGDTTIRKPLGGDTLRVIGSDSTGRVVIGYAGELYHFDLAGLARRERHPADSSVRVVADEGPAAVLAVTNALVAEDPGSPGQVSHWCGELLIRTASRQ